MPSVATSVLPGVLAEFKANYPDVTLRILEAYSGSLMDWLSSAKLDFAIVNNMGNFSGVAIIPVARDHLVLVTRWSRGARGASEIAGHKLSDYKLVLPSQRHATAQFLRPYQVGGGAPVLQDAFSEMRSYFFGVIGVERV